MILKIKLVNPISGVTVPNIKIAVPPTIIAKHDALLPKALPTHKAKRYRKRESRQNKPAVHNPINNASSLCKKPIFTVFAA